MFNVIIKVLEVLSLLSGVIVISTPELHATLVMLVVIVKKFTAAPATKTYPSYQTET